MKNLDSMGIGEALKLFPEQIKTTWKQAINSDIKKVNFDAVVVSGMGGSSNAAKIIASLYENEFSFPFIVHNSYGLAKWVNKRTLVIANTYSGNTEETLSAVDSAKRAGASILGVTTGGKLAEMIKSDQIGGCIIDPKDTNPSNYPKSGLGVSFGALLGVLVKIGVVNLTQKELFKALDELVKIRESWNVKQMAKWLHGYMAVFFGAAPLVGALNAGRNAACEIGRTFTQFYDFPEVDHVLIEAMVKPNVAKEKNKYLFFESNFNHERVKLRYKITKQILDKQGLQHSNYQLQASSPFAQALELAHYCAWIGYNISMLEGSDPGPEPWIIELKSLL